ERHEPDLARNPNRLHLGPSTIHNPDRHSSVSVTRRSSHREPANRPFTMAAKLAALFAPGNQESTTRVHADITSESSLARGRARRGRPGRSRSMDTGDGSGRSVRTSSMKTGPPHRAQ